MAFTTRTIPAHTWAVLPCTGRMPQALQGLNQQISLQWSAHEPRLQDRRRHQMWSCIATPAGLRNGTQDQD